MPDIERPRHTMPSTSQAHRISHTDVIPNSGEEELGTDDYRTLEDVMKGKRASTSQEGTSSSGGDLLPSHQKSQGLPARR
jgi:hypothetical protein